MGEAFWQVGLRNAPYITSPQDLALLCQGMLRALKRYFYQLDQASQPSALK